MSSEQFIVEYREIKGFPAYRIGSDGSVWTRWQRSDASHPKHWIGGNWKLLKTWPTRAGYPTIALFPGRKTFYVHHLVLEAFVGPCPEGMEACHSPDHNPSNNSRSNLRWDTHQENVNDTLRHGRTLRGEQKPTAILTASKVIEIRTRKASGEGPKAIAKSLGISRGTVNNVFYGKAWRHLL